MRLELGVDLDGPAFVGLLLVDDELVILVEQLLPSERKKIADAETEEYAAPYEEAECVLLFAEEFADKSGRRVEIQIVGGLVPHGLLFLHNALSLYG